MTIWTLQVQSVLAIVEIAHVLGRGMDGGRGMGGGKELVVGVAGA